MSERCDPMRRGAECSFACVRIQGYLSCPLAQPKHILAFPSTAHLSQTHLLHDMQAVSCEKLSSPRSIAPSSCSGSSQSSHLGTASNDELVGGSTAIDMSTACTGAGLGILQKACNVLRCGCSGFGAGNVACGGCGSACGCCRCALKRREIVLTAQRYRMSASQASGVIDSVATPTMHSIFIWSVIPMSLPRPAVHVRCRLVVHRAVLA